MRIKLILFVSILVCLILNTSAQTKPQISEIDKVRISEAFRIGDKISNKIWEDWDEIKFTTLLVLPEHEFLIRHLEPTEDFTLIGFERLFKSNVYERKSQFNSSFLATFPAVGGVSTIVIGKAENTFKSNSSDWVVTMLHEHFHQMQDSQTNIYQEIDQLDLSGGDQTGMWMLNYEFPYSDKNVIKQFRSLSEKLAEMLEINNKKEIQRKLKDYLIERHEFKKSLKEKDYKYFSFQLWKEGVARFTEYRIAEIAAGKYKPTKRFRQLKDFKPFSQIALELKNEIIADLKNSDLETNKRVSFYSFGAGEALILDKVKAKWKMKYFKQKFFLEKYFEDFEN